MVIRANKILSYLRPISWVFWTLGTISLLALFFGESVLSTIGAALLTFLTLGWLIYMVSNFITGKSFIGLWGIMRLCGLAGILFTIKYGYDLRKQEENTAPATDVGEFHLHVYLLVAVGVMSLLFIALGEILLYLDAIKKKEVMSEMTCPKCLGKGYVDKNDIERFKMEDWWEMGICDYCSAEGYVPRGYTRKKSIYGNISEEESERMQADPAYHEFVKNVEK